MSERSKTIFCPNPRCQEYAKKYGNRVLERKDSNWVPEQFIAKCESCGGVMHQDGTWHWDCGSCGKDAGMGNLHGLFVPHVCEDCHTKHIQEDIKNGRVCRMCGKPYSLCYC